MSIQSRTTLKGYFNTGDTPTEAQFADFIDSNLNLTDSPSSELGAIINATDAATPADADLVPFIVSSILKKITWANLLSAINASTRYVYEGDSITEYTGSKWPEQLAILDGRVGIGKQYNVAISGETAQSMVSQYATQVAIHKPTKTGDDCYFLILAGTNDWFYSRTAAQIYGDLKTLWASARADGFKVVAMTIMPATFSGYEGGAAAVNPLILSDPSLYDYMVRTDLVLPDPTDTDLIADGLHPTTAGQILIAKEVSRVLRSQLSNSNNFGIGTLNPIGRLSIKSNSQGDNIKYITFDDYLNTAGWWIAYSNSLACLSIDSLGSYPLGLNTTGGNVGVGTKSPTSTLHVVGSTYNTTKAQMVRGQYRYDSQNVNVDTAGDWRTYSDANGYYTEYCTVGNATQGGGTWVNKHTISV